MEEKNIISLGNSPVDFPASIPLSQLSLVPVCDFLSIAKCQYTNKGDQQQTPCYHRILLYKLRNTDM